jgi:RNA polymerase primary sigma factor
MNTPRAILYDEVLCKDRTYRIEQLHGVKVVQHKKLTFKMKIIEILRSNNGPMTLYEIEKKLLAYYDVNASVHRIGASLSPMKEALIVDRGVYDLYANMALDSTELKQIRLTAIEYLMERQAYVSSKVMVKDIKRRRPKVSEYTGLNGYSLLGIVQDDDQFDIRRGLMVGLCREEFTGIFKSLDAEIVQLLASKNRPMSEQEIVDELSETRELIVPGLTNRLESNNKYEKIVGGGFILRGLASSHSTLHDDLLEESLFGDWGNDDL